MAQARAFLKKVAIVNTFSSNLTFKSCISLQRFDACKTQVSNISNQVKKSKSVHKDETKISKSVFISQSSDIFTNLAIEDWLYKNFDFTNHHVMFLWVNSPCVVIGRHQNPWLEANCRTLIDQEVPLARRNSGGGAVYHDGGNLNLTFFTPVERYNRKQNLEVIKNALQRDWSLKTEINKKEDIVINGVNKISGTASKLGRPNSYHHCTLLINANKRNLSEFLHKYDKGKMETNATRSIPSPILNLADVNSAINVQRLVSTIGWEYLRTSALSNQDGGWDLVAKQRGFQMINPTDEWFPGLEKIRNEFESWEWRYGRTPKFTLTRSFLLPQHMSVGNNANQEKLQVTVKVLNGLIEDVMMVIPPSLMVSDIFVENIKAIRNIKGCRFTEDALDELNASFGKSEHDESKQFVTDCVRKVMASV